LLYHGLRCEELCTLKVGDIQQREGVPHLRVEGKGDKVRYLPLHVLAQRLITAYLKASGHGEDLHGPLFRPVKNNRTRILAKPLHPASVYRNIVKRYAGELGLTDVIPGLCVHSLRATATTWPCPAPARARASVRAASSVCRPTNRVSPRRCGLQAPAGATRPDQLEDFHGLSYSLDRHWSQSIDLYQALHQEQGSCREAYTAGSSQLLHASRQVCGLAHS